MTSTLFSKFRENLSIRNSADISTSYANITKRLNFDFWNLESDTLHRRQVGSYGRHTAIHGVSDLDMVFEVSYEKLKSYKNRQGNGASQLLQDIRSSLKKTYPRSDIKGDGQVVVVSFSKFSVDVLPAAWNEDYEGYEFPDSNDGGNWRICKPIKEMEAVAERNRQTSNNYRHVCKMLRAWKNTNGVPMGGLLIDTLVYNYFSQNNTYNNSGYADYEDIFISVFSYLGNLSEQDYWLAPGSGQRAYSKGKFQKRAKKSAVKCLEAKEAERESAKIKIYREVFGRSFPADTIKVFKEAAVTRTDESGKDEQFIEDLYPVDVSYSLRIDSRVSGSGSAFESLRSLSKRFPWIPAGKNLEFFVEECDVPKPFNLYWKVRNVGAVAEKRGIRGQIVADGGRLVKEERTSFHGPHYVEAYIVKNDVCVARNRINVSIND